MVDLRFRRASVRGFSWTGARRRDVVWGGGGGLRKRVGCWNRASAMLARCFFLTFLLLIHPFTCAGGEVWDGRCALALFNGNARGCNTSPPLPVVMFEACTAI